MYTRAGATWIRRELAIVAHVITGADALVAFESEIASALILTRRRSAGLAALVIHPSALNLRQKPTGADARVAVKFDEQIVAGALEFSCGKIPKCARQGLSELRRLGVSAIEQLNEVILLFGVKNHELNPRIAAHAF
jgi:hypothetical protein